MLYQKQPAWKPLDNHLHSGPQNIFYKIKKTEISSTILLEHEALKLEINHKYKWLKAKTHEN